MRQHTKKVGFMETISSDGLNGFFVDIINDYEANVWPEEFDIVDGIVSDAIRSIRMKRQDRPRRPYKRATRRRKTMRTI